jgi:hypothetical protein
MHVCLILQATLEVSMYELAGELVRKPIWQEMCYCSLWLGILFASELFAHDCQLLLIIGFHTARDCKAGGIKSFEILTYCMGFTGPVLATVWEGR